MLFIGLGVSASHCPASFPRGARERERVRYAIAAVAHRVEYPGTKSERLRNGDARLEHGGWETDRESRGERERARSPLHCVTKRATRPAKSLSTLMRVPRCVKIPRRRNNIGRARCFAIHSSSLSPPLLPPAFPWRANCRRSFFFFFYLPPLFSFICDRPFIGAAMECFFCP